MRQLALKPQLYRGAARVIVRDFYEEWREAMHRRASADPIWDEAPAGNRRTPFGNDEMADGPPSIPAQGIEKATAELALGVLSYNSNGHHILGVPALLQALEPSTA